MRILILSASIGSGHLKAAEAIEKSLSGEVSGVDFMSKEVSGLNAVTKKIYLAALKFIPDLYDRIYRFAGKKQVGILSRLMTSLGTYFPFDFRKFFPYRNTRRENFNARSRLPGEFVFHFLRRDEVHIDFPVNPNLVQ